MTFTIEKGVPIKSTRKVNPKYPLAQMEVGDSFLIPCAEVIERERARASIYAKGVTLRPKRFTARNDGATNLRVWRTE